MKTTYWRTGEEALDMYAPIAAQADQNVDNSYHRDSDESSLEILLESIHNDPRIKHYRVNNHERQYSSL